MAARVTPIDLADLDDLLDADERYSTHVGLEPVVERASVHYYQRSGHSFAARKSTDGGVSTHVGGDGVLGFVLAHATWSGGRPVVRVERLATCGEDAVARALVEAVVKSAYDAGVYDIVAAVPTRDALATSALANASFAHDDLSVYVRVLGSRGSVTVEGG